MLTDHHRKDRLPRDDTDRHGMLATLKVSETANLLKVSPRTVHRLRVDGILPSLEILRPGSGRPIRRFRICDVERLIATKPTPTP
jgi:hypothetical protein